MKMPSSPGVTAAGFSHGILNFRIKQDRFWTYMKGFGGAGL